MKKQRVTVILYPEEGGGYTAFLPLFPSCTTQGDTAEDALRMAKDALQLALAEPTDDDIECLELSYAPHVVVGEVMVDVPAKLRSPASPLAHIP